MNKLGYIRVAAISPEVKPADVDFNISEIKKQAIIADSHNADIALFPELSITGYTCADLFFQQNLLEKTSDALEDLALFSIGLNATIIVGAPVRRGNRLFNCAVVIGNGKIMGAVPKTHIPNYNEFYEKRWFAEGSLCDSCVSENAEFPVSTDLLFNINDAIVGIEICEDLWVPTPPSCMMAMSGAEIILNLSATNEIAGKHRYLIDLIAQQSARCRCGYAYASAGLGESSTDLVFSGNCIIAENGVILAESPRFTLDSKMVTRDIDIDIIRNDRLKYSTFMDSANSRYRIIDVNNYNSAARDEKILRYISSHPFTDGDSELFRERCDEISSIQAWGLAQRLRAINCRNTVIGISGGLDSTLALLVTVKAYDMLGYDRKGITAVTMPGFGTTTRTRSNASELMTLLGVTMLEIPIGEAVEQHFNAIGHDPASHDATYENSQARERTQILMDIANQTGGIVVGTGDLSELALGWCTYNGDQMSMYGVNASVPKTLVKYLVKGYADTTDNPEIRRVLLDIIDTPISPELLPASEDDTIAQKTEDLVGPYELHDFFLHGMLRHSFSPTKIFILACHAFNGQHDGKTIKHWLKTFYRRFFSQQFKRSCMPDGMKVGSVCLSPRGDWRMPSDASAALWLKEVDSL